ncbi:aldehyde dehydrogenase family protein [Nocardioides panacisoli]|uniref:aldehyde dehydrogenase family protein n=1 Tax=Nocardioides panacisoli TaxID=627624 RepID=UPI001C62EB81|nr:aldehyde dehydrogenase family protein [Nocardioides panacisoli]QYJ05360.1 aldehyde dehydrogenase family protein [Nocardioides panacisoli]
MSTDNRDRAERIVTRAREGEQAWGRLGVAERRAMLQRFVGLTRARAAEWVEIAARIKGLAADSPLLGEEWMSGPWATVHYAQHLSETLERMERGRGPTDGFDVRDVPGDRVAVEVLPHSTWDRLLLSGFSAEVWCEPGVTEDDVRRHAGLGSAEPEKTRGTCLVLGAGNIFSIAPLDALYVLHADNRSVALKLNPITDDLLGVLETIFAPYIEVGAVQVFTSDVELGGILAQHEGIDAVHMTGSEQTHDAIVWGPGEEGDANKSAGTPRLTKPISSELGGVSPVIVVPGEWSRRDLEFQAQHVATQRLHNSGANCVASQVVVVSEDWPQKREFLAALRRALADAPARPAWYPGMADRAEAARSTYAGRTQAVGGTPERTLLTGLDLTDATESAFSQEYFGPVLGVAEVAGTGADFLAEAIEHANQRLRGTLGANVIVRPEDEQAIGADRFEELLADLRYGTVAVNCWTAVGYLAPYATWGAFPGHPLDDVQSGRGVVHNALLLADAERTVVRGPFRPYPRSVLHREMSLTPNPPWFVDNKTAATTGRRLVDFAAAPAWRKLPGVFASALRG